MDRWLDNAVNGPIVKFRSEVYRVIWTQLQDEIHFFLKPSKFDVYTRTCSLGCKVVSLGSFFLHRFVPPPSLYMEIPIQQSLSLAFQLLDKHSLSVTRVFIVGTDILIYLPLCLLGLIFCTVQCSPTAQVESSVKDGWGNQSIYVQTPSPGLFRS